MIFFRALMTRDASEGYRVGSDYKIEDRFGVMTSECIEKDPASEGMVKVTFACPRRPDVEGGFVIAHDDPQPQYLTAEALQVLKFFTNHKR